MKFRDISTNSKSDPYLLQVSSTIQSEHWHTGLSNGKC